MCEASNTPRHWLPSRALLRLRCSHHEDADRPTRLTHVVLRIGDHALEAHSTQSRGALFAAVAVTPHNHSHERQVYTVAIDLAQVSF